MNKKASLKESRFSGGKWKPQNTIRKTVRPKNIIQKSLQFFQSTETKFSNHIHDKILCNTFHHADNQYMNFVLD